MDVSPVEQTVGCIDVGVLYSGPGSVVYATRVWQFSGFRPSFFSFCCRGAVALGCAWCSSSSVRDSGSCLETRGLVFFFQHLSVLGPYHPAPLMPDLPFHCTHCSPAHANLCPTWTWMHRLKLGSIHAGQLSMLYAL